MLESHLNKHERSMKNDAKQIITTTREYLKEIERKFSLEGDMKAKLEKVRELHTKTKHDLYEKLYCNYRGVKLVNMA